METRIFDLRDTKRPQKEVEDQIGAAAAILREGGLLAIPTETVYGLGANALDGEAVKKIFAAKGRPQDNPLIIHVPGQQWLARYCVDVPPIAYELARRFWPGPLTMILKRSPVIPDETTAGLDTVGVRCPDHTVTLAVIREAGVPVAAPSANASGRPSCTSAADVLEDMNGKIDGVVDGGPCTVGVESTILDMTCQPPRLLRPGGLPLEELENVLGRVEVDKAVSEPLQDGEKPRAPGMKYRHYAPKAPVTVITGAPELSAREILRRLGPGSGVICFDEYAGLFDGHEVHTLGSSGDKLTQAQRVFDALRSFDNSGVTEIFAQCPDNRGLGLAINNRLKKAAGFHVVDAGAASVVIGITGGTGAGKTSALQAIEDLGGRVLDCDAVYHQMLREDRELQEAIRAEFGGVFTREGELDRKKLGEMVFSSKERLSRLNDIAFRFVKPELERRMAAAPCRLWAIDAISLVESGLGQLCDRTVAVTSPQELRVRRIMARDSIDERYARMRIGAQKSDQYFREHCDCELENRAETAEEFRRQARAFFGKLIASIREDKDNNHETA
ncbi:L-threonylcarbamoyladenylate synthase [Dysosmobacter sp.]|uniref:L-threonylcarbamoyladenylate synthase n=1 Tax=Dysosmobacter sp. TaxID=2591382 RepID=UPI002A8A3DB1|nr:L-threonylcarbamoyladenylate synthase [Dysosmobacter sp.]MDY3282147.1 L-threonylcarbamoyladenylate synthase [Dysosmobacter sp.]